MSNFVKITDKFWVVELNNYSEEAILLLAESFKKKGIYLVTLNNGAIK